MDVKKSSNSKAKKEILGQHWTKPEVVNTLLEVLLDYKKLKKDAAILEPASGTGNFVSELKKRKFKKITEYEVDPELSKKPVDFFTIPTTKKFDLVIGNPPFTKYNLKESYYRASRYKKEKAKPETYLTREEIKADKQKIENAFILKSIKHLKNNDSTIAFILPVSFFIKNKNKSVKEELTKRFKTILVYQNDKVWFDRNIPCSFAVFSNIKSLENKIVVIYENGKKHEHVFDISAIHEELIPQVIFNKNHGLIKNRKGIPLSKYLESNRVRVKKSFTKNNVSAKNIISKDRIPQKEKISDYKMAVVRVGNSSVGKCGLVNVNKDILNDMFYVFDFKKEYDGNKKVKEAICRNINSNLDYFRNITCRVGSKSIKKENVFDFRVEV